MTRDEVLQFALSAAKDDYLRGQARVGLVETKAQLISATVGILLTFLVAIPAEHVPHSRPGDLILLVGAVGALLGSLIMSIAASLLTDVRPPQSANDICSQCEELIKAPGSTAANIDGSAAEVLVGNVCGSYLTASKEVLRLLSARMNRLRAAQVALVIALLFMIVLIGPPYLLSVISLFNIGVDGHG